MVRVRFHTDSRTPCPDSYLLLRPGEPLLDVDGQFPGGDPFPCLGHVAGCGRAPRVRHRTGDEEERQREK